MKLEKVTNMIDLCYVLNTDGEEWDIYQEAKEEIAELERLATEYQSPETQRLIELGKAVEKVFDNDGHILVSEYNSDGFFICDKRIDNAEEILEWHREQEGKG